MLARLRGRLPFAPADLGTVMFAALALACAEFVRSGLYAAYLPQVAGPQMHLPLTAIGAAWTAHFAADTLLRGPAGALITRFGPRWILFLGALLSLAALACLPLVDAVWKLLLIAAVHGAAFSVMWPGVLSLSAQLARQEYRGRAISAVSVSVMPLIGAGVLAFGALARLSVSPGSAPPGWWLALGVTLLGTLIALKLPAHLSTAPAPAKRSRSELRRALLPLLPLLPAAFVQNLSLTLLGPLLFTLAPKLGVTYWGVVGLLACGGAAAALGLPLTGRWADRGQARLVLGLGFGLVGTALALLSSLPPLWALYGLAAALGAGYACILPGWAALVTGTLPEEQRAAAWGALMSAENAGTALGPLLGTLAYALVGVRGPFELGAVLALGTGAAYLLTVRATRLRSQLNKQTAP